MPTVAPYDFDVWVETACFLGDVPCFALGDGTVRLMDGKEKAVDVHKGAILSTDKTGDDRLLTGGDDGAVKVIDRTGLVSPVADVPRKWIDHVAAGPRGVFGFAYGRMAAVHLTDGALKEFPHERTVEGLSFAPKGLRLATAHYNGATLLWVNSGGDPVSLEWKGAHTGVLWSPAGRHVVTLMQENALHGWDLDNAKHMRMTGYPSKVKATSWAVKGKWLATSGANAAVLWPFSGKTGPMGQQPLQLGAREVLVSAVACHPTEDVVAVGYQDGMIMACRFADQNEVLLRRPGKSAITSMAWSKDGVQLAFGCEEGEAGLVDIR
ncbi:WD40 repeat domain-containing protein [Coralliovum pocilloporae]|uniref:WD40 repeat domain-containing protein n=1 Tax=Coralliovum pocilloporae TaxID=3066369 RepID=UPI0033075D19